MEARRHYFVVVEDGRIGVGFCSSWALRDSVVLKYKKKGHIAQMIVRSHPYAKWLRETVEYNETLDGKVILFGRVCKEGDD